MPFRFILDPFMLTPGPVRFTTARLGLDAPLAANFQSLNKSNRRAGKIEFLAQPVFKEPLKAEMQRLGLIGE
jgi:hypothetical protein